MRKRVTQSVAFLLVAVMLFAVPGIAGCGGDGGGGENVIVIGVLTDFTGTASFAVKPTIEAMIDYFKWMEEEDPIPGVKVRFDTYDTRLDYARVIPGYMWLLGRDPVIMHIINPADRNMVADRAEDDQMPVFGSQETTNMPGQEYIFNYYAPLEAEVQSLLQWIMDTWDYDSDGVPKIGHIGWALDTTTFHQNGIDYIMENHPGKFEFVGLEKAPMGTSTWAVEIGKLEDSDYILSSVVGSMMASFVNESRERGYEGGFLSGINAFPGYWDNARAVAPAEELYKSYYAGPWPWWGEDVPFITGLTEATQTYHPNDAARLRSSGPITGWGMGLVMYDAVKRAVEAVGAENVDGPSLRQALMETELDVEGFGNTWQFPEGEHFLCRTVRVFEWSIEDEDWVAVSDWIVPESPLLT